MCDCLIDVESSLKARWQALTDAGAYNTHSDALLRAARTYVCTGRFRLRPYSASSFGDVPSAAPMCRLLRRQAAARPRDEATVAQP